MDCEQGRRVRRGIRRGIGPGRAPRPADQLRRSREDGSAARNRPPGGRHDQCRKRRRGRARAPDRIGNVPAAEARRARQPAVRAQGRRNEDGRAGEPVRRGP